MEKNRLDLLLVEKGLIESRERAKTTIMSGRVFVNGMRALKPGASVARDSKLEVRGGSPQYVSRGGQKLEAALTGFGVSPKGRICLDCGASTGGFTDCLLQNGAKKVYAVDVGYGQLAWSIRNHPDVVVMERTNIRNVTKDHIPDSIELAVIDVSFISLKLVLPAVRGVLADYGAVLCLVKPQFEAGRDKVGKKGVVRDAAVHIEVLERFLENAQLAGFSVRQLGVSPIKGPEGNIEFLAHLQIGDNPDEVLDIKTLVLEAHAGFQGGQEV